MAFVETTESSVRPPRPAKIVESERRSYAKNREKKRERALKYKAANYDKVYAYGKEYAVKNRESLRTKAYANHLKKTYGLTPEDVQRAWDAQEGKCGICKRAMLPSGKQSLSRCVDHDHETGKFRELLCRRCNGALGMYEAYKDGIDAYLQRHPKEGSE